MAANVYYSQIGLLLIVVALSGIEGKSVPANYSMSYQISNLIKDCPNYSVDGGEKLFFALCNKTSSAAAEDAHLDDLMCSAVLNNMKIICSEERKSKDRNEDLMAEIEGYDPEKRDICADLKANLTKFDCQRNADFVDCETANENVGKILEKENELCAPYCVVDLDEQQQQQQQAQRHFINPICTHLLFTNKVIKLKFPEFIIKQQDNFAAKDNEEEKNVVVDDEQGHKGEEEQREEDAVIPPGEKVDKETMENPQEHDPETVVDLQGGDDQKNSHKVKEDLVQEVDKPIVEVTESIEKVVNETTESPKSGKATTTTAAAVVKEEDDDYENQLNEEENEEIDDKNEDEDLTNEVLDEPDIKEEPEKSEQENQPKEEEKLKEYPDFDSNIQNPVQGGVHENKLNGHGGMDSDIEAQSSFFSYFVLSAILCIVLYLIFHNKQKILALILEGRRRRTSTGGRRRGSRGNSAQYRKLDNNLEEAMGSNSSDSVRHIIY